MKEDDDPYHWSRIVGLNEELFGSNFSDQEMEWINNIYWTPGQGKCITVPSWLDMNRAGKLIEMKFFQTFSPRRDGQAE